MGSWGRRFVDSLRLPVSFMLDNNSRKQESRPKMIQREVLAVSGGGCVR